jgi:radical SAM superfamily enzyme YgiQ (UPF0313 family)
MKITLIKPKIGDLMNSTYIDEARMEPLQLGIIAGFTPKNIEVKLYDDRLEKIPYDEPTDIVAITIETFTAKRSYEISREYMKRGVKVIMGGMHSTLFSEEVEEHADSIVIGDAETVWKDILKDFNNGKLKKRYYGKTEIIQNNSFPRRELFKNKGYLKISLMQFSRGCTNKCNFCATSKFFEGKHYCREINEVIREIKEQKLKFIFFVDDNIIANKIKAKEVFRQLIPLKIKWVSQASLDMLEDEELMELMVKSGCLGHVIGFESTDLKNLDSMQKSINISNNFDCYKSAVQKLRKWGLQTWAAFTVGHEHDTVDSIKKLTDWAIKNKFTFAAFNILMPYPNTPLYEKLKKEKRLLYNGKWWLHKDYRFNYASFIPKNMTPEELTEAAFNARKRFNSYSSIFRRAFDFKTNMRSIEKFWIYLQYNPLFRRETFKKQGMHLGKNL